MQEDGFTSFGMVVALLLALSLVFSTAQVYRVSSASADIQDVADVCALAAENEVAEFMVVARVCDAVVLSLTLAGIVSYGAGIVALLVPPVSTAVSTALLKAGKTLFKAREQFSSQAMRALDALQRALPFIAAANAASVGAANKDAGGNPYLAIALLLPDEGMPLVEKGVAGTAEFEQSLEESKDGISQAASKAEEVAKQANAIKERAFERDCGDAPSYCMYERALTLAGMDGSDNPRYESAEAWSFSVALARAKAYYPRRFKQEAPKGSSVKERARSALRANYYRFAASEVARGYVYDNGVEFEAHFPDLPSNTDEMRTTSLYTERIYPVTRAGDGFVMHAWEGCPAAVDIVEEGSIQDMEKEGYATCAMCEFKASSLGTVAAASTSIDNGFEYHYAAVAREAEAYDNAREKLSEASETARADSVSLFEKLKEIGRSAVDARIDPRPPGTFGAVAFVVNLAQMPASVGFETTFVKGDSVLGARAAVSAATMLPDPSGEGESVLASLLDGVASDGGVLAGAGGMALDAWSALLGAYVGGQDAVAGAIDRLFGSIPLASESGLGSWGAGAFSSAMESLGLEPADLDALKPVTVNSVHVARADSDSAFSARFIAARDKALAASGPTSDVFSSLIVNAERSAYDALGVFDGNIEIARISPLGDDGPAIPIEIALPQSVRNAADGLVEEAIDAVRSLYANVSGVRVWS